MGMVSQYDVLLAIAECKMLLLFSELDSLEIFLRKAQREKNMVWELSLQESINKLQSRIQHCDDRIAEVIPSKQVWAKYRDLEGFRLRVDDGDRASLLPLALAVLFSHRTDAKLESSCFEDGRRKRRWEQALECFLQAAELEGEDGDIANTLCGELYLSISSCKNPQKGVEYLTKAAKQGYPIAMLELANYYYDCQDYELACDWFRKLNTLGKNKIDIKTKCWLHDLESP